MEELNIVYKPIKELKPYKKNAKKHSKEQVEQIANSIKEFGFTQPVIIDKHNSVVAGHGRILGAKKAGLKQVPTVCLEDLTEEQIKAYRLVDNKLNESEWDYSLLDEELENLEEDIDMNLFGFDEDVDLTEDGEIEVEVKDDTIKYFSDEQIIKQALDDFTPFKSLKQFVSSIIDKPTAMYQFNRLCQGYNDGYNISLLFNPHRLATGTKKNEQSIYQALNKNGTYKKQLFRFMIKVQNKFVTKHNYFKFVSLGCGGVQYVNEFQPYLARDIYRTYCKDGYTILDPCAGWGGRTIGLASCMFKNIKYLATDPSKKTYNGLLELKDFLGLGKNFKYKNVPFEDLNIKENSIDFCFTSPPYYDTEHYSDDSEQSYKRYASYAEWKQSFLYVMLDKIYKSLKVGGVCLLNVGNVLYPIENDIKEWCIEHDIEFRNVNDFKIGGNGIGKRTGNGGEPFIEFTKIA
jgi:site-specific DNA-adenine methylase